MTAQAKKEQTGRAGEFLAAYILESNGVECHRVDRRGDDLWCKLPNGKLVTVQVKAEAKPSSPRKDDPRAGKKTYYRYHTPHPDDADWYIFVALDVELIRLMPSSDISVKNMNMPPHSFNANAQANDIAAFLGQSVGGSE